MTAPFTLPVWTPDDYTALLAALRESADEPYRVFHSRLLPGVDNVLGVRAPKLRNFAKQIARGDFRSFLTLVTDNSYEEAMLHGLVLGYAKLTPEEAFPLIEAFLPAITNWAICDMCTSSLRVLTKEPELGFAFICKILGRPGEYEKRFAIVAMLDFFLEPNFIDRVLPLICGVTHEGYYVKMAVAWALSVAFVRFREKTLEALAQYPLDDFTYNKTLQKCCESFRVSAEDKKLLRSMKR